MSAGSNTINLSLVERRRSRSNARIASARARNVYHCARGVINVLLTMRSVFIAERSTTQFGECGWGIGTRHARHINQLLHGSASAPDLRFICSDGASFRSDGIMKSLAPPRRTHELKVTCSHTARPTGLRPKYHALASAETR